MNEKKDPRPTGGVDQSPERIDPRSGLARLKEAMRQILTVPKSAATDRDPLENSSGLK